MVGETGLGHELPADDADAGVRVVHIDEGANAAPSPQATRVPALNVARAQLARAHVAVGLHLKRIEESRELAVGNLVRIDQEALERDRVPGSRALAPVG